MKQPGCFQHQVIVRLQIQDIAAKIKPFTGLEGERVGQADGLKHAGELVVAISALSQDLEGQVYLGVGL